MDHARQAFSVDLLKRFAAKGRSLITCMAAGNDVIVLGTGKGWVIRHDFGVGDSHGKTVVVGAGLNPLVQINLLELLMGKTLKGTVFGGLKSKTHRPLLLHKSKNKEIQLDELLTHEMKLKDVPRAHEILKRSDCVKILIKI